MFLCVRILCGMNHSVYAWFTNLYTFNISRRDTEEPMMMMMMTIYYVPSYVMCMFYIERGSTNEGEALW